MKNKLTDTATKADIYFTSFILMAVVSDSAFSFWWSILCAFLIGLWGGLFKTK